MYCHAVSIGKCALLACNFIFLLSGICLVALGCILAYDTPRLLISLLAMQPGAHVQPLLYYVSMGCILVGMLIAGVAAVGCWAGCMAHASCLMALHMSFLITLLVGEMCVGTVAALCPQLLGVDMDRDTMVDNLQRNYGLPARDHYTAAVDLAQTLFECCGMSSGADYDNAFWRDREVETERQWRVPASCCLLNNTDEANAFLDPKPLNHTLCQAKTNSMYQYGRYTKGCLDELNTWFHEHSSIFLITGLSLLIVQLSVLVSSIFLCIKRGKVTPAPAPHEFPDSAPQPRGPIEPLDAAVLNDQVYPTKRSTSPVTLPLALMNEHVLNKNPYTSPKVFNNAQRIVDNLQKNFVSNGENNNYYGQSRET